MDWNETTENRVTGMQERVPEPESIHLPEDVEVTKELIEKLISNHQSQVKRAEILMDYYLGYAPIMERVKDPNKPNNKLVAPYPSYISDILTGMFIGEPPTYSSMREDNKDLELLQTVFDYNDEQDENFEIAKFNSIMGKSYEIVYVDDNLQIRFNELSMKNVIYVYDNKINPEPLFALYIRGHDENRVVKLYHKHYFKEFRGGDLTEVDSMENVIGLVPIIESRNNNEMLGDFERVLSLIDAYNKTQSDTANDLEEFTDAFLVLSGMANADEKDIAQMKRDKVIVTIGEQGAEWLIKNTDNKKTEDHKTRLDEDIHRFTKIPNLTDDKFGGNSSGVALKYKLLALRQVISMKERKFKRFLQDRLELIIAYMKWLSQPINIEHYDIEITFNSNIPIDEEANVRMVKDLMGMVSENTALSQLFFIDNANEEQEKKEQENTAQIQAYSQFLIEEDDIDEEPR